MIQHIDAPTLKSWLENDDVILIDVREADEFQAEHIEEGRFFPLSTLPNHLKDLDFPAGSKIVLQCRSGMRSQTAYHLIAAEIADKNYDLYNLEGGILGWKKQGFPVISG